MRQKVVCFFPPLLREHINTTDFTDLAKNKRQYISKVIKKFASYSSFCGLNNV